jgi:hypothetical protein
MRLKTGLAIAGAVALVIPTKSRGQIVQYNFANADATGVTLATMETATTTASNATAANLSLGTKTDTATDEGVAAAAYWASPAPDYLSVNRDSTATATDDTNFYVQFTVTANPGFVIDPTSLTVVGGQGGGTAGQRSFYVTDSADGLPSGANDMTGTGSGPFDTNANGTIVGDWAFSVVRNTGANMDSPTIAFPATDANLASFTVRVYFDTVTDAQNIDLASFTLNGSVVAGAPVSQWTSPASGDYNVSSNWNNGVPNAVGAEADFLGAFTSNHTVFTDVPITLGKLVFNNSVASYALTGAVGTSLTLQTASGSALVDVKSGTHELNLPLIVASNTTLETDSPSASLIIANPVTINSGMTLSQSGSGTVTYQSIVTVNSDASIAFANSTHAHELSLASGAIATVGGPMLEVDSLSNLGTINLLNNKMLINYGSGPDPIASIEQWIKNGADNLPGPAIISSDIAADDALSGFSYGIGYADSADPGDPANLPSGTIEVMFTLLGDANLDGTVNSEDFTPFSHNLGLSGAVWDQGDFNYDGTVNAEDFTSFSHNLNQSAVLAGGMEEANGISLANVPEPASLGLLACAAISMLARRQRLGPRFPSTELKA